jgi:hypothetical protein
MNKWLIIVVLISLFNTFSSHPFWFFALNILFPEVSPTFHKFHGLIMIIPMLKIIFLDQYCTHLTVNVWNVFEFGKKVLLLGFYFSELSYLLMFLGPLAKCKTILWILFPSRIRLSFNWNFLYLLICFGKAYVYTDAYQHRLLSNL